MKRAAPVYDGFDNEATRSNPVDDPVMLDNHLTQLHLFKLGQHSAREGHLAEAFDPLDDVLHNLCRSVRRPCTEMRSDAVKRRNRLISPVDLHSAQTELLLHITMAHHAACIRIGNPSPN